MKKEYFLYLLIFGYFYLVSSTITVNPAQNENRKTHVTYSQQNQTGFTFEYVKYALTQLNSNDFSWKFLKEFDESGDITIIGDEKKIIFELPGKGKELFIIEKIQKNENGFIASTNKNNILIFAIDYNRIAFGEEGSNIFAMFIFKDYDRENINRELLKMRY